MPRPAGRRPSPGELIGRTQLDLWARGLSLFTAERARHDPARFCDVRYDDLVADPAGTVEAVYGYFGLPLAGAAADAIRLLAASSASWRRRGRAGPPLQPRRLRPDR